MHKVRKGGWNTNAALLGPFWYLSRGLVAKGIILLTICLVTIGIGIIPVWIYCGVNGNKNHYRHVKSKGFYIIHEDL